MKKLILLLAIFLSVTTIAQVPDQIDRHSQMHSQSLRNSIIQKNAFPDLKARLENHKNQMAPKSKIYSEASDTILSLKYMEAFEKEKLKKYETSFNIRKNLLKSGAEDNIVLDSVYGYRYNSALDSFLILKVFMTYIQDGHRTTFLRYELDTLTNDWTAYKEEYFADQNGRDTLVIIYNMDLPQQTLVPIEKYEQSFDAKGNSIMWAWYYWDSINKEWIGGYKRESLYENNGFHTITCYYQWDTFLKGWIGYSKTESVVNEFGIQIMYAYYYWDDANDDWRGIYKSISENQLTQDGNLHTQIYSVWEDYKWDWRENYKYESLFGNDGNFIYDASYNWSDEYDCWIGEQKANYYHKNPWESTTVFYVWNFEIMDWELNQKTYEKNTDSWDNIITLNYTWNKSIQDWVLTSKSENIYNELDQMVQSSQSELRDTLINATIRSFDSTLDVDTITGDNSCSNQNCISIDSIDFAEGNGALLWNYDINKSRFLGGYVQVELMDSINFAGTEGILLEYKNLVRSRSVLAIILTESGGEEWKYIDFDAMKEISGSWNELAVSYTDFIFNTSSTKLNGIVDPGKIEKVTIRIILPSGVSSVGSILIDNLRITKTEKSENWITTYLTKSYYDGRGNTITDSAFIWNEIAQKLWPESYTYRKYDSIHNQLSLEESYILDSNGSWIGSWKSEMSYNEKGYQLSSIFYEWDYDNANWKPHLKYETDYNDLNYQILSADYIWDNEANKWVGNYKYESTYDEYGNQISESSWLWSYEKNQWKGNYKYEYVYNINHEQYKTIDFYWDDNDWTWKINFVYFNNQFDVIINEFGQAQVEIIAQWNEDELQWLPIEKNYYFYSQNITRSDEISFSYDNEIQLYPNPAVDYVNIQLSEYKNGSFKMFSNTGQLLRTGKLSGNITCFDLIGFAKGNYILHIETDKTVCAKKLIIQ